MEKVLFIPAPVMSHINASFKIAHLLQKHQYQVYYYTYHAVAPLITQHRFACLPGNTTPLMEGYRLAVAQLEGRRISYRHHLRSGAMRPFFNQRRHEVREVVEKIRPHIIVADMFAASDFALLYPLLKKYQIRFFQLETMPCTLSLPGIPPFFSPTLPWQKRKLWLENLLYKGSKRYKRFKERWLYFGNDTFTLLKKELRKNGVPRLHGIERRNYYSLSFQGLPTLLPIPIELEYFQEPPANYHYLGFIGNGATAPLGMADKRLTQLLHAGKPVVYISFGTVFAKTRTADINRFMQVLDEALDDCQPVTAIFSLGSPQADPRPFVAWRNISVFSFVPQVAVLKHCSVFITHGGINSFKEGIEAHVPILVVPLAVDQLGNAGKAMYKQVGLVSDIRYETAHGLKEKIKALLSDERYKKNLHQLHDTILRRYNPEQLLMDVIREKGVVA